MTNVSFGDKGSEPVVTEIYSADVSPVLTSKRSIANLLA